MDSLWSNLFRRSAPSDARDLLKPIPLFESLTRRQLAAVERILYRRAYAAGELIFRQGEPGVGMYIVAEGRVTITYEPSGEMLAELRDGDFFGEIALLNETPRSATARAHEDSVLWGLFHHDLLQLIRLDPGLGVNVLLPLARIAGQRLVHADRQIQALRDEALLLTGTEPVSQATLNAARPSRPNDDEISVTIE